MATQPQQRLSPAQYLDLERQATGRSEFYDGEVFAMAGASERHNLIVSNLVVCLGVQLRGRPCRVYANDLRLKVSATGLYTYPDVIALCSEPRFDDEQRDTLLNPDLIIEVLSESTEGYDRGEKFAHYRKLESLTDYLLVAQQQPRVEHYTRQVGDHWLLADAEGLDAVLDLPALGCRLPLAEVYAQIDFQRASLHPLP